MSNQPLGFSRVTAHDVISLTSMKLHPSLEYLCIRACVLLVPPTDPSFIYWKPPPRAAGAQ